MLTYLCKCWSRPSLPCSVRSLVRHSSRSARSRQPKSWNHPSLQRSVWLFPTTSENKHCTCHMASDCQLLTPDTERPHSSLLFWACDLLVITKLAIHIFSNQTASLLLLCYTPVLMNSWISRCSLIFYYSIEIFVNNTNNLIIIS